MGAPPRGRQPAALALHDGFARIARIAAGLTLIRRVVLEAIATRYPELLPEGDADYAATGVQGRVLQCFEQMPGPDGFYLGEDISFSHRWSEGCSREIWPCGDEIVTHWRTMGYTGQYISRLRLLDR